MRSRSNLRHINENKRVAERCDYYRTDDPNIVMEVKTIITEVHIDVLQRQTVRDREVLESYKRQHPGLEPEADAAYGDDVRALGEREALLSDITE